MLDLYVDIDACPVYREVAEAAHLHRLDLYVVTRGFVVVPAEPMVHPVFAEDDDGSGEDWIANNISTGDICITEEIRLAARCVLKGALALKPSGYVWADPTPTDSFKPRRRGRPLKNAAGDLGEFAQRLETAICSVRAREPMSVKSSGSSVALGGARFPRISQHLHEPGCPFESAATAHRSRLLSG
jgi:uncharacterized protein YaiI (UPF0178 family)